MLISFSVENFRSFGEEQTLNLVASKSQKGHDSHCVPIADSDEQVLRMSLIYGANAAGKSNLVKAIAFARDLVLEGAAPMRRISLNRFRFTEDENRPSSFEFRILVDEQIFTYGFEVTPTEVLAEWLSVKSDGGRETDIFTRDKSALRFSDFGKLANDASTTRDALNAIELLGARSNQLLLNVIYELDRDRIGSLLSKVVWWFSDCLTVIEPDSHFASMTEWLDDDEQFRTFSSSYLKGVATGIGDLSVQKTSISAESIPTPFLESLQSAGESEGVRMQVGPGISIEFDPTDSANVIRRNLTATHTVNGKPFSLPFQEESDGTQRLMNLMPALYHLKNACKVYVIDEMDRSLHPLLSHSILKFFVETCPGGCQQLIVTSHETHLLDQELLRRDEIWFAEKDEHQQTQLSSLSEFGIRKDLRLERGYLQGRFGGVPTIHGMDRVREFIECPPDAED